MSFVDSVTHKLLPSFVLGTPGGGLTYNFKSFPHETHENHEKQFLFFDRIDRIWRIRIQNQKFLLAEAKLSEIL